MSIQKSEISEEVLDNYKSKLDDANKFLDQTSLFFYGIAFGVLSSLLAGVLTETIHKILEDYDFLYSLLIIMAFFLFLIKLLSFVIKTTKSKYQSDKAYQYYKNLIDKSKKTS